MIIMSENMVVSVIKEVLYTAMLVGGPILILALLVGLLVSIFQATTQIQEQTLTFVPKLIVIGLVLAFGGNWMLKKLVTLTIQLFNLVANIKG
jgi:flagellar biosynthetic protein FliQ